jgi:hypothetical protein
MSNLTLIIGETGTGKSTSLRNLDPKETFIINILDKPLPFKGFKKNYVRGTKENRGGNYASGDNHEDILKKILWISDNRPDIKVLIIDDFQYTMCNEFMRKATERGFEKFTKIGKNAWEILSTLTILRRDLNCFILTHSDIDEHGRSKFKTIGKLLDDKVIPEGFCTVLLHTVIQDGKYLFLTQHDGTRAAKSPMGMFDKKYIDNDLAYVIERIKNFEEDDEDMDIFMEPPNSIPAIVTDIPTPGESILAAAEL